MAAEAKDRKNLPNSKEVVASLSDPTSLVALGDSAVDHVLANPYKYDSRWSERLWMALANLKDALESKTRINSSAAELAFLLLHPKEISRSFSRAEIDEIAEPTEEEAEAWA